MKTTVHSLVRTITLSFGLLVAVFFLLFLIGEGLRDLFQGKTGVIPILVLMIFSVTGYGLCFRKGILGSLMMVAGGLAMAIYLLAVSGLEEFRMALIFGLPFIIPGVILYFYKK